MGSVVLFYRFVIFVVLFVFFFFCFLFFCSSSLPAFILFAYNRDSIALVDPKATPICIMHSKEVKCMSSFSSCRL